MSKKIKSKHQRISTQLEMEISGGKYPRGGRLPSEIQLVKQFGVSRPTVARALRDLEDKGLVERRAGSGTYVSSNQQSVNSTRVLGLLVPGSTNTEIFHMLRRDRQRQRECMSTDCIGAAPTNPRQDADASLKHAEEICKQFIERKISGVFFAPAELQPKQEEANIRIAESLREAEFR